MNIFLFFYLGLNAHFLVQVVKRTSLKYCTSSGLCASINKGTDRSLIKANRPTLHLTFYRYNDTNGAKQAVISRPAAVPLFPITYHVHTPPIDYLRLSSLLEIIYD